MPDGRGGGRADDPQGVRRVRRRAVAAAVRWPRCPTGVVATSTTTGDVGGVVHTLSIVVPHAATLNLSGVAIKSIDPAGRSPVAVAPNRPLA
jgi:hypothetical protein